VAPEIVADGVDARWAPTAQAMLNVFARVLADAQHNRRGDRVLDEEVADLIAIGAPLVSAALQESPAADRAKLLAVFGALGPVADDLVPLLSKGLRHQQRDVRIGAATALGALGRSAGAARDELRKAAQDEDEAVRSAALDALKAIEARR
jgi:HEAT repeat protein